MKTNSSTIVDTQPIRQSGQINAEVITKYDWLDFVSLGMAIISFFIPPFILWYIIGWLTLIYNHDGTKNLKGIAKATKVTLIIWIVLGIVALIAGVLIFVLSITMTQSGGLIDGQYQSMIDGFAKKSGVTSVETILSIAHMYI